MRLSRIAALLFAGYLACSFAAGVFVADGTVHPIRRPLFAQDEMQAQRIAHAHQSDLSDVLITVTDGAILRGWSFRSHNSNPILPRVCGRWTIVFVPPGIAR